MFRWLLIFAVLIVAGTSLGASCLAPIGVTETTDDSGQPSLVDGDFPDSSPCSDRDTLPTDTVFLEAITNAEEVIHIHKEYTTDEALPAVCGLSDEDNTLETGETEWNPEEGADADICYALVDNLSSFFVAGSGEPAGDNNAGVCRSNFGFDSANTADGFPRAGTYRIDACIAGEETGYQLRVRVVVSGEDVNKTLALAEVEDVTGLEVFNSAGTEAVTTDEAKQVFVDNPNGFTFTIRSGDGVNTHLTVSVLIICIQKVSSCPTPTQACS